MTRDQILSEVKAQNGIRISLSEYAQVFGVGIEGLTALHDFAKGNRLSHRWAGASLFIYNAHAPAEELLQEQRHGALP